MTPRFFGLTAFLFGCCCLFACSPSALSQINEPSADVIVYGSTPGGFSAAIAAAREGADVILIEPTNHVGGLSTGGLSHCDSNQMVRSTCMGLFNEWHRQIVADYTSRGQPPPYDPTVLDHARWTFEPHVAMRVTLAMLEEAGVTVLTERYLESVEMDGPRIRSITTTDGTFSARVFVDGTYEGDLMAMAGVDWTIGRESRDAYDESLAGRQYTKRPMNFDGYDDDGNLLPLITHDGRGEEAVGDENIMTYSFRLCLTRDADNFVPIPEPDDYDPARFEAARRYLQAGGNPRAVRFDMYPLPGDKLDGNNSIGSQFSIGLIGGGVGWAEADQAGRAEIWEAHKQYTLEFIHFITTDPAVPENIRNRYAGLGFCGDEFAEHDHFPPALYVRESRRMLGMHVISQRDILDQPTQPDPIAISSFPIDSHDCRRVATDDGQVINEGTIFPVRVPNTRQGYAFHVPYRSVLPLADQCDNLLVPVALSCTHVGISSLRIEGTWMVIGQGAGVAAAMSAERDVAVQELDYTALRDRLLAQGQVLELPGGVGGSSASGAIDPDELPGIVLDDQDAELEGAWSRSTHFSPYVGGGYLHDNNQNPGQTAATFRFTPEASGRYTLGMAYSAHPSRSSGVPVLIRHAGHRTQLAVDQRVAVPEGEVFRPLGEIELTAGEACEISLRNSGPAGFVILDAIQLLPVTE